MEGNSRHQQSVPPNVSHCMDGSVRSASGWIEWLGRNGVGIYSNHKRQTSIKHQQARASKLDIKQPFSKLLHWTLGKLDIGQVVEQMNSEMTSDLGECHLIE